MIANPRLSTKNENEFKRFTVHEWIVWRVQTESDRKKAYILHTLAHLLRRITTCFIFRIEKKTGQYWKLLLRNHSWDSRRFQLFFILFLRFVGTSNKPPLPLTKWLQPEYGTFSSRRKSHIRNVCAASYFNKSTGNIVTDCQSGDLVLHSSPPM